MGSSQSTGSLFIHGTPQEALANMQQQHITIGQRSFVLDRLPLQGPLENHSSPQQCSGPYAASTLGLQASSTQPQTPNKRLLVSQSSTFSPALNNAVDCAVAPSHAMVISTAQSQPASPAVLNGLAGSFSSSRSDGLGHNNNQQLFNGLYPRNLVETAVGQPAYCAPLQQCASPDASSQFAATPNKQQPAEAATKSRKKSATVQRSQGVKKQTHKKSCGRNYLLHQAQIADAQALLAASEAAAAARAVITSFGPPLQGREQTPSSAIMIPVTPSAPQPLSACLTDGAVDISCSGLVPSTDVDQPSLEPQAEDLTSCYGPMPSASVPQPVLELSDSAVVNTSCYGPMPSAEFTATDPDHFPPCKNCLDFISLEHSVAVAAIRNKQQGDSSSDNLVVDHQLAAQFWQEPAALPPLLPVLPQLEQHVTSASWFNNLAEPLSRPANNDNHCRGAGQASDGQQAADVPAIIPSQQQQHHIDSVSPSSKQAAVCLPSCSSPMSWTASAMTAASSPAPVSSSSAGQDCAEARSSRLPVKRSLASLLDSVPIPSSSSADCPAAAADARESTYEGSAAKRKCFGLIRLSSSDSDMVLDSLLDPEDIWGTASKPQHQPVGNETSQHQGSGLGIGSSDDDDELVTLDVWCLNDSLDRSGNSQQAGHVGLFASSQAVEAAAPQQEKQQQQPQTQTSSRSKRRAALAVTSGYVSKSRSKQARSRGLLVYKAADRWVSLMLDAVGGGDEHNKAPAPPLHCTVCGGESEYDVDCPHCGASWGWRERADNEGQRWTAALLYNRYNECGRSSRRREVTEQQSGAGGSRLANVSRC